jgi:hypothetical protein
MDEGTKIFDRLSTLNNFVSKPESIKVEIDDEYKGLIINAHFVPPTLFPSQTYFDVWEGK